MLLLIIVFISRNYMTPTQTMMKFEKQHPVSMHLYERLRGLYVSGIIEDGLFSNQSIVKREYELMRVYDSHQSVKNQLMINSIHLFSVWRNNKSIFKFDEDLAKQVVSARVPPDLNASVMQRIPHWAVYIELPRAAKRAFIDHTSLSENHQILGFWALSDKSADNNKDWVLRIHLHIACKGNENNDLSALKSINIPITSNLTLAKCAMLAEWDADGCIVDNVAKNIGALNTMLGLVLCLCVDKPDVVNVIGLNLSRQEFLKPRYKHIKSRKLFEVSIQPHYYDIGSYEGSRWREMVRVLENDVMAGRSDADGEVSDGQWVVVDNISDVGVLWEGSKIN